MPQCLHCQRVTATAELRRLPFGRGFTCKDVWACRNRVLDQAKEAQTVASAAKR